MGLRDKYREWEANQDAANAAQIARGAELRGEDPAARALSPEAHAAALLSRAEERSHARARLSATCPLPLADDPKGDLPSGVKLQPDEFLVVIGKDWGWSSQRLILTTHRVISTQGRASKSAQSMYLVDVRDVRYSKPMIGTASITLESASGFGGLEGLPAAKNGSVLRDQLTALVHWARTRHAPEHVAAAPSAAPSEDVLATIERMAKLRDAGALTPDEFEAKKRELLDRL